MRKYATILLLFPVLLCVESAALAGDRSCQPADISLKVVKLERAGFHIAVPENWDPVITQGIHRVRVEESRKRCVLQWTVHPHGYTLQAVVRLHQKLYSGECQHEEPILACRNRWKQHLSWARDFHLGHHAQRYGSAEKITLVATRDDEIVVATLRCRNGNSAGARFQREALALFASFSPISLPKLPE